MIKLVGVLGVFPIELTKPDELKQVPGGEEAMMTEKQAAVMITLSIIVQQQLDPSNPLHALLQGITEEMCDEMDMFGIRAPDVAALGKKR